MDSVDVMDAAAVWQATSGKAAQSRRVETETETETEEEEEEGNGE
jgi:hypothetical protein